MSVVECQEVGKKPQHIHVFFTLKDVLSKAKDQELYYMAK